MNEIPLVPKKNWNDPETYKMTEIALKLKNWP